MKVRSLLKLPNLHLETSQESLIATILSGATNGKTPPAAIAGQFSLQICRGPFHYLIRDRLGINKLFYHVDRETGTLTVGNFIYDVAVAVNDFNRVYAVPPGHYLKIDAETTDQELVCYYDISKTEPLLRETFDVQAFQENIRQRLAVFFTSLNQHFAGCSFFVCLSGGLDSTLVATYASRYLDSAVATTFSYRTGADSAGSEDFTAACAIARQLEMPFIPLLEDKAIDLAVLDQVLLHCQDWRDFNVHCAWVNHHIGQAIRRRFPDRKLVFLTGDLMNEFVADYTSVTYGGQEYYRQPNVSRERLRRFLVYGLDTSDRETGIFHQWDITTVQPYALLAEEYLRVPPEILDAPDSKEILNLDLIPDPQVRELIVKTKVRAQVGGSDGGTLGLFHDHRISQALLKERWDRIFSPTASGETLEPMIISGRYRSNKGLTLCAV